MYLKCRTSKKNTKTIFLTGIVNDNLWKTELGLENKTLLILVFETFDLGNIFKPLKI